MDKVNTEKVNKETTEYGLTEPSEDGLLCVQEEVQSSEFKVEIREGNFLPVDMLRDGARELGVELSDDQIELLDQFASLLVETNRTLNLTRITEPEDIVTGHYLDSFTCLAAAKIKHGASVIDIGTGAGFPGIPIEIIRPDLAMTLLDSSRKKLKFIEGAVESLKSKVESWEGTCYFVHARAEEAGRDSAHRDVYDVAFARALSDMKTLAELCLPLVKVGGVLIAQKSDGGDEEIDSARPLIGQLGGRIERIKRIKIPQTDITRRLVVISKVKQTPLEFPRPFSRIARKSRET